MLIILTKNINTYINLSILLILLHYKIYLMNKNMGILYNNEKPIYLQNRKINANIDSLSS